MKLGISNWLFAQTHRNDLVGTLSRLWVEECATRGANDVETWLDEKWAGQILRPEVEEARKEFAVAAADVEAGRRTPTYPNTLFKIHQSDADRWTYHRAHPEVTARAYWMLKQQELTLWLSKRAIIYLDTNHWVNLRKVILQQKGAEERYAKLLGLLLEHVEANRICCPVSHPLLEEVRKQSDENTRFKTAEIMDKLSGGVCLQHPCEICRHEINYNIGKKIFPHRIFDCRDWIWTKAYYIYGATWPTEMAWDAETQTVIQKVIIDLFWDFGITDVLERMGPEDFPPSYTPEMVSALKIDAEYYKDNPADFDTILKKEKAVVFHSYGVKDLISEIATEFLKQFPEACERAQKQPHRREVDPNLLPSLQILGGINATFVMDPDKVDLNYLLDAAHSALGIPYCDIFMCDRAMAHRLKSPPLDFDEIYSTRIEAKPELLIELLESDAFFKN